MNPTTPNPQGMLLLLGGAVILFGETAALGAALYQYKKVGLERAAKVYCLCVPALLFAAMVIISVGLFVR